MTLTLVTGVTGTVGNAVVHGLRAQNRAVRCLVRDPKKCSDMGLDGVEFVQGDLTDKSSVVAAFKDVSHVIHAGGIPEQWVPDEGIFDLVNVNGTQNMVDAALTQKVTSFVYVSTQDIFDLTANPFDETMLGHAPLNSAYERSKQKAEAVVSDAYAKGLPAIFINPAAVYGPGGCDVSGLNSFFADLLKNDVPILLNGGIPVVFNADLAAGILAAETQANLGEHYIFYQSYHTLSEMAQAIALIDPSIKKPRIMPDFLAGIIASTGEFISGFTKGKPIITKGELGVLQRTGRPSSAKARMQLGWDPIPFAQGLAQTIPWIKDQIK